MPEIKLNPADKAILEVLEEEHQSVPARIAELTDYDRQYVHKRLQRLEEHQIVEGVSHGLYRYPTDDQE